VDHDAFLALGCHDAGGPAPGVARATPLAVARGGPACHPGGVSCFRDDAIGGVVTTPAGGA
jgi:hypothetical protein